MTKENFINVVMQQAAARAPVLNCMPEVPEIEEGMRTDEETTALATAAKLVNLVNVAGNKMSKSTIFLVQRTYTFSL